MFDGRFVAAALVTVTFAIPLAAKPTTPPAKKPPPAASASASTPPPAPSSPEEAEARRHFETGLKLYKEKLYEAALVEFEQSYKIVARPSALRNVAQCQRDLKRFAEAYAGYERLLAVHGAQLTPAETAAVKKALKELESFTGFLSFDVSEAGATVTIDGREIGQTPLAAPVRVDVGPRTVRIVKVGFETFERTLTLTTGQSQTIEAKLAKDIKTGSVTIKDKAGAKVRVFVDDVDRGPAPQTLELTPGAHIIELRGDGVLSARKTIEVAAKSETEVVLEATALRGTLRVETLGKKGTIFVDGKQKGEGAWEGPLPPGTHQVKVVAEGYEPHERLVAVEAGQKVVEAVTLVPIHSPAGPVVGPAKDPYRGLYGRLALIGAFSTSGAGEEVRPLCDPTRPCSSSDSSKPMGAGSALHVGYSFGVFAAEFVGVFLADYHETKRNYQGLPGSAGFPASAASPAGTMARTELYKFWSLAAFTGLGGRVTSKDDAVRFTAGLSIGHVYRSSVLKRETLDDGWRSSWVGASALGLYGDAGLLLGTTPGFKLSIGVNVWVDFPSGQTETEAVPEGRNVTATYGTTLYGAKLETPAQKLRSSTQLYIGPTLGFQFGR